MKRARIALTIVALVLPGCTASFRAQVASYGSDSKVTVYSGGKDVRVFRSNGKVLTEEGSDGWYFQDKTTGKLVRVSGTVVVEQE